MNRKIIVAAIGFVIAVAIGLHFYAEWQMARFDASLPTPPPPAEEQSGGHWHGDEWHAEPHTVSETGQADASAEAGPLIPHIAAPELPPDAIDLSKLSPEELEQAIAQFYAQAGVEPPPEGYDYLWEAPHVVKRDENGEPILHKNGEPVIEISYQRGFAPTYEQYQRFKQLRAEALAAEAEGDLDTAQAARDEMKWIWDNAQGDVPAASSILATPVSVSAEEAREIHIRYIDAALDEAYQEIGLGYMRE